MQKVALRRTFFEGGKEKSHSEPKIEVPQVQAQAPAPQDPAPEVIHEEVHQEVHEEVVLLPEEPVHTQNKTWDDFLSFLFSSSPALASNLEQGNITTPLKFEGGGLSLEFAFTESGKIFYDYLQTPEVFQKIKAQLATFFNCTSERVSLTLTLLKNNSEGENSFLSKADEKAIKEKEVQADKERQIAEDPMIKEVEKIFKAKIDKIVLNNS